MIVFARVSIWIAGPIILAVIIGKKLDVKFDSAPKLFLISVGIAFIISIVGMFLEVKKSTKLISDLSEDANKNDNRSAPDL